MKKKLALLAAPIAMLAASTAMAANFCGVTPYVGADAELRHMNFQRDFGRNLFTHNYPQGNLYAGVQINEYLAVEGGYETTEIKHRTNTLRTGDTVTGILIDEPDTSLVINSTGQVKGLHANLIGLLPICDLYRLKLIGMVGYARLQANFVRTSISLTDPTGTFLLNASEQTRTYKARKSILRLGAGLQHMINCNWGVRAMLKWEDTKRFKIAGEGGDVPSSIRARNSFIYSIGTFYTFN